MTHLAGIGYQELTKMSNFGHSDVYEGCMVVKSWGSNRQFNLLQNEYHIELITYFRFKNPTNSDLSMNICDASLNFQWATSMNIQWISIVKLFVPPENIVQWTAICIHWKISEYIISISEITKVNVHKFNMVLILKLLNAPCTCFTFGMRTNQIYV